MKKVFLAALMTVMSSAAYADSSSGTVEALHVHDHFSMFIIKGATAQKVYERLQTPEKEGGIVGDNIRILEKISVDGRMYCQKYPQGASYAPGTYRCDITFDTTTGEINPTWAK